jgi:DUF971 family protein
MDTNSKYLECGRMCSQSLYQVMNMKLEDCVGAYTERIAITKLAVSGRRSVRMEQSDTHSCGYCEVSYLEFLRNFSNLFYCD